MTAMTTPKLQGTDWTSKNNGKIITIRKVLYISYDYSLTAFKNYFC